MKREQQWTKTLAVRTAPVKAVVVAVVVAAVARRP